MRLGCQLDSPQSLSTVKGRSLLLPRRHPTVPAELYRVQSMICTLSGRQTLQGVRLPILTGQVRCGIGVFKREFGRGLGSCPIAS